MELTFQDILKARNIDLNKCKLVRHAYSDPNARLLIDSGFIKEYTETQDREVFKDTDYIFVFVGYSVSSTILKAAYRIIDSAKGKAMVPPEGYPFPEHYRNANLVYYRLEETDILSDLTNRLSIDWGGSARRWVQNGTTIKNVAEIKIHYKQKEIKDFSGYEDVFLTYSELKEIIEDPYLYADYHQAFKSVYAIYMIQDKKTGKKYIGSAYAEDGLFGRWKSYVDTISGGNKLLEEIKMETPDEYKNFVYTIIRLLPKTMTPDEVIKLETHYKNKFMTKYPLGLNLN